MEEQIKSLVAKIADQAKKAFDLGKKSLGYLRINDEKNRLSLTNIAMILIIYKIYMTAATTFEDLGMLLGVLSSYQAKRFLENRNKVEDSE